MLRLKEAVIVEGKYDKIKLSSVIESVIIEVGGFRIFKDPETLNMIRSLAKSCGVIILTDSDSAGFLIRGYLGGSIPEGKVIHAYIPDIYGKEKRKEAPSSEGKLGVEGVSAEMLCEILRKSGATDYKTDDNNRSITHTDFYEDGLSGKENSVQRRKAFARLLGYPEHISTSSLIDVLNRTVTYDQYKLLVGSFDE